MTDSGTYNCACSEGYKLLNKTCKVNYCHKQTCGGFGTCVDGEKEYACSCIDNYKFEGGTCKVANKCVVDNGGCPEHSECRSGLESKVSCVCKMGYKMGGGVCSEMAGNRVLDLTDDATLKITANQMPAKFSIVLGRCLTVRFDGPAKQMTFEPGVSGKGFNGPQVKAPYEASNRNYIILLHRNGNNLDVYAFARSSTGSYFKSLKSVAWTDCPVEGFDLRSNVKDTIPLGVEFFHTDNIKEYHPQNVVQI